MEKGMKREIGYQRSFYLKSEIAKQFDFLIKKFNLNGNQLMMKLIKDAYKQHSKEQK